MLAIMCKIKIIAGANRVGDILIHTRDNQFAKAVTTSSPIDFPAAKNFSCAFS